ncbi:hypothetical protein [Helicobacter gastrofelis]|uniref:hypothetical protein n=1 Tax=Helicobacter gastrofelis TaxID=2849642 RepID=UPI001C85A7F6|nr:hypothetical protein [Helicobacter sp. NHP19-012]
MGLDLSLNDSFWIVPSGSNYLWQDFNLYDNPLNTAVSLTTLTGQSVKTKLPTSGLRLSPELTTNGMLKKCWQRDATGEITPIKGQMAQRAIANTTPPKWLRLWGLTPLPMI